MASTSILTHDPSRTAQALTGRARRSVIKSAPAAGAAVADFACHIHCVDDTHTLTIGAHTAPHVSGGADVPAVVVRVQLAQSQRVSAMVSSSGLKRPRPATTGDNHEVPDVGALAQATGLDEELLGTSLAVLRALDVASSRAAATQFHRFEAMCGRAGGPPSIDVIFATTAGAFDGVVQHLMAADGGHVPAAASATAAATTVSTSEGATPSTLHPLHADTTCGRARFTLVAHIVCQTASRIPLLYEQLARAVVTGSAARSGEGWESGVDAAVARFSARRSVEVKYALVLR